MPHVKESYILKEKGGIVPTRITNIHLLFIDNQKGL